MEMSESPNEDELRACLGEFESLSADWKTEVLADLLVDYIPPSFATPFGDGYVNSSGCYVVSSFVMDYGEGDVSVMSDEDSDLRDCEGYNDVIFETSTMVGDVLVDRKKNISSHQHMVINCGEYSHISIPNIHSGESVSYCFNETVEHECHCETEHVFKPLECGRGRQLVSSLKTFHLTRDCFVCFAIEDAILILSCREKEEEIDLVTVSRKLYNVDEELNSLPNTRATVQCWYCRDSATTDFNTALPHFSVHCIWNTRNDEPLAVFTKPPYSCTTVVNVRCTPGEQCSTTYSAYLALTRIKSDKDHSDMSCGEFVKKTDALLRCEHDTSSSTVLGARSDLDFTEQLYVLLSEAPRLYQQECLQHVLDYISNSSIVIPDVGQDNETPLAKLVLSTNEQLFTLRNTKQQIKVLTSSSNWATETMQAIGVNKILNDYAHYFKSIHDSLQFKVLKHFNSYNGLEKLYYIVEMMSVIQSTFDPSPPMRLKIVRMLLDTCLKHDFDLKNVPTFRIVLPSTSTFNDFKQTMFDDLPMIRWSCFIENDENRTKTMHSLQKAGNDQLLNDSNLDNRSGSWTLSSSSFRTYTNFPSIMKKHFEARAGS